MRKLDSELPLWLCLQGQARDVGGAKSEPSFFTRRGAHVTDGADRWARANHRLAREELLAVTAHAGIVIGKVGNVGKVSLGIPLGRKLVTSVAREAFVLIGRMKSVV